MKKTLLAALLFASACTAGNPINVHEVHVLQGFINHDIREVVDYYGDPDYAYTDAIDGGQRIFLWTPKRAYIEPPRPVLDIRARGYDTSPWFQPSLHLDTVNPYRHLCTFNFVTHFYEDRQAWMVERIVEPQLRCENDEIPH